MEIIIKNKRCKKENILKEYPDAIIIDVTSKGEGEWQKLSPFYPHGGIPVPFSDGIRSMSVEGVWQGLKVFENGTGIDRSSLLQCHHEGDQAHLSHQRAHERSSKGCVRYGISRLYRGQKTHLCAHIFLDARKQVCRTGPENSLHGGKPHCSTAGL